VRNIIGSCSNPGQTTVVTQQGYLVGIAAYDHGHLCMVQPASKLALTAPQARRLGEILLDAAHRSELAWAMYAAK
jgi:hypothetical protein